MPTYKNWNDLVKGLQKKIDNSLAKEVAQDVKEKLKQGYEDQVYSYDYNQSYRDRRDSLADDKNIVSSVDQTGTLIVESIAQPDSSVFGTTISGNDPNLLSRWIEDGSITNIFNDQSYPWTEPRPVIQETQEEIEKSGSHIQALKKGLKRQGIELE